jgi:hypothetical protein
MQRKFSIPNVSVGLVLLTSVASAQSGGLTREDLVCPCLHPVNRFGLSYRAGFSISARFKNVGGYAAQSNPGAAIAGIDHTYDDGYNRVDTGTNSNATWFWGYENASQISGNTVTMTSSSAPGNGVSGERKDDPQHGVELTYNRELGHFEKWRWGVETALNYTDVVIGNNAPYLGPRKDVRHTYQNLGSVFPEAPYHGTFEGPGDLISTTPVEEIRFTANGARTTGNRQFDADIYGFRVGPYLELPLDDRWAVSLSGGLALLSVNSDFNFRETVTMADRPAQTRRGNGSNSDILPGGYIGGNFLYAVRENVNLFAGAQFQTAGTYSHKESGKEVEMDLGKSVFINLGVGFSF